MTAEKQGGSKPADEAKDATAMADEERVAAVAVDEPATTETIDAIAEEAVGEAVSAAEEASRGRRGRRGHRGRGRRSRR